MLKIKYLYRLPKGGIKIRSELTTEYPDEDLTAEEAKMDLRIIGFVFWISALRTAKKPK
jgi:phage repressor protein C with HTH and peptisase S24 domain